MKQKVLLSLVFILLTGLSGSLFSQKSTKGQSMPTCSHKSCYASDFEGVKIDSYVGTRINNCIDVRVKGQDVDHLIEPFRQQNETRLWQSEFWGKWILGALDSYRFTKDPELFNIIKAGFESLLKTQLPNGYIGNYTEEAQLQHWDIWGRKYTMLGLMEYYDLTGDDKALQAAIRVADHLLTQVGPGKVDIVETGNYRGMASSSVLEPIVKLYNRTSDERYLDFGKWIVARWESEKGPKLITKALNNVPVAERFPAPKTWWSWENGQKAYEMMSCYEGLLQLYLVEGKKEYLEAVKNVAKEIIASEINIAGSGAAFECWYHGKEKQTDPAYHTMETCVTMTWMKLCKSLLEVTGNPVYADQFEKTMYNALFASLKEDASEISKYSPLEGNRHAGEKQCGMNINCCNANGPRGYALIPSTLFMQSENGIAVNLYAESEKTFQLKAGKVHLIQHTSYPETGAVLIEVNPEKTKEFTVSLRIPLWSEINKLTVNGELCQEPIPGSFYHLKRKWNKGDKIELELDLRGKVLRQNGHWAIVRGPVTLARDSRLENGFVDKAAVVDAKDGIVNLTPVNNKPDNIWMAFTAPAVLGTDLEGEFREPKQIMFCDFSSAGNTWDLKTRYKVWIKETLNVMTTKYDTY